MSKISSGFTFAGASIFGVWLSRLPSVQVDLLVRGICCLRPGLKNVSENIRVISVVGRFLEHSRIFYFYNSADEEIYLGSADLMTRNLNHRVEVVFPVESAEHVRYLRDHVLDLYLKENAQARLMQADGTYKRVHLQDGDEPIDIQEWLMNRSQKSK